MRRGGEEEAPGGQEDRCRRMGQEDRKSRGREDRRGGQEVRSGDQVGLEQFDFSETTRVKGRR